VVEMALLRHNGAWLHATELTQCQVVGQGTRGHEDSRLLAQHLGEPLLKLFHDPTARKPVRRNTHVALKDLKLANQPPCCLRFASTSEDHGNVRLRRLWLAGRWGAPYGADVPCSRHGCGSPAMAQLPLPGDAMCPDKMYQYDGPPPGAPSSSALTCA